MRVAEKYNTILERLLSAVQIKLCLWREVKRPFHDAPAGCGVVKSSVAEPFQF
jgi:hypothetical protein